MDVDLCTEDISAEESFELDENIDDYSMLEGERCGICMDIVIDRGVLDCCQHWFCFTCIDNWATITNLCPLCQNEFQLITCVPVYDTIGSNKIEDDTFSRDDDWCIEGKSNTLSFPSYYIDENAVTCLDGDGCKIRNGSAKLEEDLSLDTSIACDSCDIWYHAFCVGFDTEGTCENSWLCPRCLAHEDQQKVEMIPLLGPSNHSGTLNSSSESLVQASYSGKVSVSIADTGETALVVSMVEGNQVTESTNEIFSKLEANEVLEIETRDLNVSSSKLETQSDEKTSLQFNVDAQELGLSLSCCSSFKSPCNSVESNELKRTSAEKAIQEPSGFSGGNGIHSNQLFDVPCQTSMNLQLGLSVGSSLSGEDQMPGDLQQSISSDKCLLPTLDDKNVPDTKCDAIVDIIGAKRKHVDYSFDIHEDAEDKENKARTAIKASAKKVRSARESQITHSTEQVEKSVFDAKKHPSPTATSEDEKVGSKLEDENATSTIMSIVQGADCRSLKRHSHPDPAGKSSKLREKSSGLRVKKILRRAPENQDSSILVQNLRKEIREAVRNKSSKEFGEKLFDPKLLDAFKAAVSGPHTEPSKKLPPLAVKAKKSMLQKGKIRENLTRKIYGIGGRRKRAWTRDCEVEFWKYRCLKTSRPEKIETLKSVLDLLRKNPETTEWKPGRKEEPSNSILSRLYLADASLLPRKDDVKPLMAVKASGNPEENKGRALPEKAHTSRQNSLTATTPGKNVAISQSGCPSLSDNGRVPGVLISKDGAASAGLSNKFSGRPSPSLLGSSKGNSQIEMIGKSVDVKSDKRKWALEVLARKTAAKGGNAAQGIQEDLAMLKGNYPLLAQLPIDMRPVLAPCRHNKIPMSVRQAQLYRLTEHFLREAKVPIICRTADTELAVADAVNIEKGIADRSNSKLVYVNLCSQELLHRSDKIKATCTTESNSSPSSPVANTISELAGDDLCADPEVEEALRNTGLLSDSPPTSPTNQIEVNTEDDPAKNLGEEGPANILEMDSHPELDIYGDFEFDLEDEDYIGYGASKISNQQVEEDSQIKVVFSTVNFDIPNNAPDKQDHARETTLESSKVSSCSNESQVDANRSSTLEGGTDRSQDPSMGEGSEELSLAECDELYGPDKEPLINRFPEQALMKPCELKIDDTVPGKTANPGSNQVAMVSGLEHENGAENSVVPADSLQSSGGEKSSHHPQTSEHVTTKEKVSNSNTNMQSSSSTSISKKVEAYIKEHIRPLCKSGVINVEQYRWAVSKTTEKVMKFHSKEKNANFLIKEGEKVKKLAEQYVETAQQKGKS